MLLLLERTCHSRQTRPRFGSRSTPDLALEIDITSKSLNRMPIYARLGVPKVLRYDDGTLKIYVLQGQGYVETNTSLALPMIPIQEIIPFIERHRSDGKKTMRRAFREWVRQIHGQE